MHSFAQDRHKKNRQPGDKYQQCRLQKHIHGRVSHNLFYGPEAAVYNQQDGRKRKQYPAYTSLDAVIDA